MTVLVDSDTIAPLLAAARDDSDATVRAEALEAASRFPMDLDAWKAAGSAVGAAIRAEPRGGVARRRVLDVAARFPLTSVRQQLRDIAGDARDPDHGAAAAALESVGDASRVRAVLERARAGDAGAFRILASMPVENHLGAPGEVPPTPPGADPDAALWSALTVARLGEFAPVDAILRAEDPPPLLWGSPWVAYERLASIRPVPARMREHLIELLANESRSERSLIVWAVTGVADAKGRPPSSEQTAPARPRPSPTPEEEKDAIAMSERIAGSRRGILLAFDTVGTANRAEGQDWTREELARLAHLPPDRTAARVRELVSEGNRLAREAVPRIPVSEAFGNRVVSAVDTFARTERWPVRELALEHLGTERPALDDGQLGWVLSRCRPERAIDGVVSLLTPERTPDARRRLLKILAVAADHYAGRGGSPYRGAGGEGAQGERPPLVDDVSPPSPITRKARVRSLGRRVSAEEPPEERRVQARILHAGKDRKTFVTGAKNVIRCWIGLPEAGRATSDAPIPRVDIPARGLQLEAVLIWGTQTATMPITLPADRSARTGDCDLSLRVPDGECFVSAEIAFRYRGRAFEIVRVEALALAPGEPEQPQHQIRVRVQLSRREVIALTDSNVYDATVVWGDDGPGAGPTTGAASSLRVFGNGRSGRYELPDADVALAWLGDLVHATEKSLVRQAAARASTVSGEPSLDAGNEETLKLLRSMAHHGAELFSQLKSQGFVDPGERIQLLNCRPQAHVPLEFVYDRGHVADDATLCEGWRAALVSDDLLCPVCGRAPEEDTARDWVKTICPLGFWSLQKIIERLDPGRAGDQSPPAARPDRRQLPVLGAAVFASSHNVPEDEREATWETVKRYFPGSLRAEDWEEWKRDLQRHPSLLVMLPHHDAESSMDYLAIGDDALPAKRGRLPRDRLTKLYVNPDERTPGPIVLLLGCETGSRTSVGYVQLTRKFQLLSRSIVLGTMAKILGRNAAPVARELLRQLVASGAPSTDFGTLMRRVRRRMLANGYLMALGLTALGDAEWRLTPSLPHATIR